MGEASTTAFLPSARFITQSLLIIINISTVVPRRCEDSAEVGEPNLVPRRNCEAPSAIFGPSPPLSLTLVFKLQSGRVSSALCDNPGWLASGRISLNTCCLT